MALDRDHARYLVVSDIHLTEVAEPERGWMYYKRADLSPDADLAELIADFTADAAAGVALTLVLNGDIFDFDLVTSVPEPAPWKVRRAERRYGLDATPAKSAWKMERMVADHPTFIAALGRFVAAGHRVVYILGNHDRELVFPQVQRVLSESVAASAAERGRAVDPADVVRYEPWALHEPGAVWIEHGQQYDDWSAFADVIDPVESEAEGAQLALPMGNLSCRFLINRIGTFNPHDEDFIRSGFAYVVHWLRYYALSRHNLILSWLWGSVLIVLGVLRARRLGRRRPAAARAERLRAAGARQGLSAAQVDRLRAGFTRPVSEQLPRLLRELWMDRLLLIALMTGGTIALALAPIPLWVQLMVPLTAFPLLWFLWDGLFTGSIFDFVGRLPAAARNIADTTGVPVVVFGHTHDARLTALDRGRTLANSGTWAPVGAGLEGDKPLTPGKRNYVLITVAPDDAAPRVELGSWMPPAPTAGATAAAISQVAPACSGPPTLLEPSLSREDAVGRGQPRSLPLRTR